MRQKRLLLYPFGVLYGMVMSLRNFLFDKKIASSYTAPIPLIGFGNLNTGGTGKTPHTLLTAELFLENQPTGVLSRGYGRSTKGFFMVEVDSSASDVGDEPLMMKRRKPGLKVAVCENRSKGIQKLLQIAPNIGLVILDDVMQHRSLKLNALIMLTEYGNLFTKDHVLPAGNLREFRSGYCRAQAIIVTKSPGILSPSEKALLIEEIKPTKKQRVFFSSYEYGMPVSLKSTGEKIELQTWVNEGYHLLLVTGIAHPEPLLEYIENRSNKVEHLRFADHHVYSQEDIRKIRKSAEALEGNTIILTTEKDTVRLEPWIDSELKNLKVFYIPIEVKLHEPELFKVFLDKVFYNSPGFH